MLAQAGQVVENGTLTGVRVTGQGDEWFRIGALETYLDGSIFTGTALMRQGWGEKAGKVFGNNDPAYRGLQMLSGDELYRNILSEFVRRLEIKQSGDRVVE